MASESFDAVLAERLEVVAWRNRVGDRWFYAELDPREVHDNGKQTDALILASDHKAAIDRLAAAHAAEVEVLQATLRYAAEQGVQDQARAEAAEQDARRLRFCIERDVFPVIANDGKTWVMFVAVSSARRSMFASESPEEAIDAAIAAQQKEEGK